MLLKGDLLQGGLRDAEPRDAEWHRLCDPMQVSLHAAGGWQDMECVYRNA
jgi:hypothetical protein